MDEIELAVREFDSRLLTNFNFRNPDSFRINLFDSGLEEVRAILSYQLLHKHALIVATRLNQLAIDTYERSQTELTILSKHKILLPNKVIDPMRVLDGSNLPVNQTAIKQYRAHLKSQVGSLVQPLFYNVLSKKIHSRSTLAKDFSAYLTETQTFFPKNQNCV